MALLVYLICIAYGTLAARPKISDVYLLLPQTLNAPNAKHVKYVIQAYEGCYKWYTANSKVVAVTELNSENFQFEGDCQDPSTVCEFHGLECYPGALLEPVAMVEHPPVTLITAVDQTKRGETLKCEVKVGRISRLEILTTVKSFRVLDNQKLFAQAFDEDGNVFSSLEGLRFRWQIVKGSESMGLPKLKDSWATLSPIRREIENSNYQSDMILVEGKSTGVANITLKIEEPGYENLPLAWTVIFISEPYTLLPSPEVYLPTCAKFSYRLFKILEGKIHKEVPMPTSDYHWSVTSKDINIGPNGNLETQTNEGKWSVIVHDSKIESNIVQCEVNVVRPDRMIIAIEPYIQDPEDKTLYTAEEFSLLVNPKEKLKSNWYIISGKKYLLRAQLFWRNKEITIPSNAVFSFNFGDNRLWQVVSQNKNKGEMVVIPILPDDFVNNIYLTKVSAKLERFETSYSRCLDTVITDTEEANIIRPVRIMEDKKPVLLPYFAVMSQGPDKKSHLAQEYKLKVTGGSYALTWESKDSTLVSAAQNGIIYAHRLGKTIVTVIDLHNEQNFDSVEVEVALVEQLQWESERIELVRGTTQTAEIKGFASQGRAFHNCSSIFLDWEAHKTTEILKIKNKVLVDDLERLRGVCEIRGIEALNEGQAIIVAHLIHEPYDPSPIQPEIRLSSKEGRIGIFNPLSLGLIESVEIVGNNKTLTFNAEQNAIVLTPGSTAVLELLGGPLGWEDYPSQHKEIVKDGERAQILQKKIAKEKRYLKLQCPEYQKGKDYVISLSVFNEKFEKLTNPGMSQMEFILGCFPPASLKLDWVRNPSELTLVPYKSLPTFFDRFRRPIPSEFFDSYWAVLNSQELLLNVTLSDMKNRQIYNFSTAMPEYSSDKPDLIWYTKIATPPNKKAVKIGNSQGPVVLEARIDRLKDGTVISPAVVSSLNNEIVNNVQVMPEQYSVYLHARNVLEISILHGSGYFEVTANSTDILQFTYDGYRKISVFPKRSGRVSIKIEDIGLPGSDPAFSNILVSPLAGMELKEGGLIPVNSTISLTLISLDSEGRAFSIEEMKWMGLELSVGDAFRIISTSSNYNEWELKGHKLGEFQVYAIGYKSQMREDDKYSVRSNVVVIDVFPPLEIVPGEILLLPGAKYTLNYRGGPDPSKYSYYSIFTQWVMKDEKIANIDSNSGLLTALKVGDTPIELQMIRKRSLLTQAGARIRVRLATSVGIIGMGPGRTVLKDSATRLIAQLYHMGEEFTDSTMPISYTWKSNSPTVYSIFQENEDPDKQVAVTGLALTGGKSDITLHVDIQYPNEYRDADHLFNSKATASVDSGMFSQTPSHRCHSYITFNCEEEFPRWLDSTVFLMPPHSSYRLSLSKEEKTSFRCLDCREDFLKITDNGILTTGSQKGESTIVVQHGRIKGDYHIVPIAVSEIESIHIDRSYTSRNIALGSELEFDIIYQDSMARSFPKHFEYGIDVGLEVSNSRVLQATFENRNTTLKIYSQYVGETIVKVFLNKNPSVKDIIKVSVTSVMKPVSPISLHLGGEIQFETTHSTPAGITGSWSSENSNILIVSDSGYAKSLQEGDTYVHYREKSMDLKSLIVVNKVKAIELGHDAPQQITNYEKFPSFRDRYKVPIRLFADIEKSKEFIKMNEEQRKNVKQNIHVRCFTPSHADFVVVESEIEKAEKDRWSDEPGYGCYVTPITNPTTVSIAPRDLVINVVVSAKGKSLYIFESSVSLPFVPKFTLPGQDKQIILTGKLTSHSILISGACVTLQANSDTPYISVRKYETSGKCMLEISILNTEGEIKLRKIEIIDSITGQKEELLISYYADASKADFSAPMGVNDFFILLAMIVLLYVIYNYFKNTNPQPVPPYRGINYPPPPARYPGSMPPPRNTPGPIGPASTPSSSAFKNIGYRPNF